MEGIVHLAQTHQACFVQGLPRSSSQVCTEPWSSVGISCFSQVLNWRVSARVPKILGPKGGRALFSTYTTAWTSPSMECMGAGGGPEAVKGSSPALG